MDTITIRIIDNRTGGTFDYPLDATTSDQLLGAILAHVGYQGDGSGAMQQAIDYWIQQSRDLLESQIRSQKSAEAEQEIKTLRAAMGVGE